MGVYIFLAVLAALVIFVGILLIRTALAAKKAEPIGEKPVYTTEREDTENGERLMKMIECQTVSSRESVRISIDIVRANGLIPRDI